MSFHVIIPARYASSRFPGKPLAKIQGKEMVCHVIDKAVSSGAKSVTVATDDQRIFDCVIAYGSKAVMTASDHESGTDRLEEAASKLGLSDDDIVVNVQGDEPLINSLFITQVAENLAQNPACSVSTLCEPIHLVENYLNPNMVKVLWNNAHESLYFSRSPIPWDRDESLAELSQFTNLPDHIQAYRHLGIYGYRVSALKSFVTWPVGRLEQLEKLEQLRFLEQGIKIHVSPVQAEGFPGVDTPEDLEHIQTILGDQ